MFAKILGGMANVQRHAALANAILIMSAKISSARLSVLGVFTMVNVKQILSLSINVKRHATNVI